MTALLPAIIAPALAWAQGQPSPEEIYKVVLPSVVTLSVEYRDGSLGQGSGFLAMQDGCVVTAWHVVQDAKSVTARFSTGEKFECQGIIDKDEKRDLALLSIRVGGRRLLSLANGDPAVGSKAYVVGAPLGLEFSISDGLVSQIQTIEGVKQYQFSCPSYEGNSGGPLIGANGQVLGVVSWQVRGGQTLNFAVPVEYVRRLNGSLAPIPWGAEVPSLPSGPLDPGAAAPSTLRELEAALRSLGYDLKTVEVAGGAEELQLKVRRHGLEIPVQVELSASKSYAWLTVYLADIENMSTVKASRFLGLLRANARVQPVQFYINELDQLVCGLAIDNRGIKAPILKRCLDMLLNAVGLNRELWNLDASMPTRLQLTNLAPATQRELIPGLARLDGARNCSPGPAKGLAIARAFGITSGTPCRRPHADYEGSPAVPIAFPGDLDGPFSGLPWKGAAASLMTVPGQSQFAAKDLKSTLEGMGHELKVLEDEVGKEKWEFTINRHELDIPVGAEISASKNYIWLTVYLGDIKDIGAVKASKLVGLLKGNSKVQPAQFYITESDGLWCALPIDNRALTTPVLKRCVDMIVDAVGKNQDLWEGF